MAVTAALTKAQKSKRTGRNQRDDQRSCSDFTHHTSLVAAVALCHTQSERPRCG